MFVRDGEQLSGDWIFVNMRRCSAAILTLALSVSSCLQRELSTTFWARQKRTVWERSSTGDREPKPTVCVHQGVCVTNMWPCGLAASAVKDASSWATAASCPTSLWALGSTTMMLLSGEFRPTQQNLIAPRWDDPGLVIKILKYVVFLMS